MTVHYTGWLPRALRRGYVNKGGGTGITGPQGRSAKRSRIGNAQDRAIYKNPRVAKMFPDKYAALCRKSDRIFGIRRGIVENA